MTAPRTSEPRSSEPSVYVAGIGNIFLADDGFGVEVAQRLQDVAMPDGVTVRDVGIRGVHLAYDLLDGYDALVLIDTLAREEPPGTITVLEADAVPSDDAVMDSHTMDPRTVLGLLDDLGGSVDRVLVVGCEPADLEERIGLSEPVAAVVDEAARIVQELVQELVAELSVACGATAAKKG